MIGSRDESNAGLRRDIERWRGDLSMWVAAGLGNGNSARTIRQWIAEAEWIIGVE
jgi:hypothetical protein